MSKAKGGKVQLEVDIEGGRIRYAKGGKVFGGDHQPCPDAEALPSCLKRGPGQPRKGIRQKVGWMVLTSNLRRFHACRGELDCSASDLANQILDDWLTAHADPEEG